METWGTGSKKERRESTNKNSPENGIRPLRTPTPRGLTPILAESDTTYAKVYQHAFKLYENRRLNTFSLYPLSSALISSIWATILVNFSFSLASSFPRLIELRIIVILDIPKSKLSKSFSISAARASNVEVSCSRGEFGGDDHYTDQLTFATLAAFWPRSLGVIVWSLMSSFMTPVNSTKIA